MKVEVEWTTEVVETHKAQIDIPDDELKEYADGGKITAKLIHRYIEEDTDILAEYEDKDTEQTANVEERDPSKVTIIR